MVNINKYLKEYMSTNYKQEDLYMCKYVNCAYCFYLTDRLLIYSAIVYIKCIKASNLCSVTIYEYMERHRTHPVILLLPLSYDPVAPLSEMLYILINGSTFCKICD